MNNYSTTIIVFITISHEVGIVHSMEYSKSRRLVYKPFQWRFLCMRLHASSMRDWRRQACSINCPNHDYPIHRFRTPNPHLRSIFFCCYFGFVHKPYLKAKHLCKIPLEPRRLARGDLATPYHTMNRNRVLLSRVVAANVCVSPASAASGVLLGLPFII